jgi:hypothetical protein
MEEFLADEGTVDADSSTSDDLLQLQVASMSMFTSCAWFFADVSGIETVQILRYAERALQLIESLGADAPRTAFQEALSEAISNRPEEGTGADVYGKMLAGLEPSAPAGQVQRRR